MRTSSARYLTPLLALAVLVAAALLWKARSQRPSSIAEYSEARRAPASADDLLAFSQRADETLSYRALVAVTANYSGRAMKTSAQLSRAPHKLSIHYLSGAAKGMQSGYNERWFWRQANNASPLEAYAEVARRPDEMTAHRFALMKKNYRAALLGSDAVDGRAARVVELTSRHGGEKTVPARRLWIDEKTGLTLRADAFNYRGQPIMSSTLSRLEMNPSFSAETFVAPAAMLSAAQRKPWVAQEMGAQFQAVTRAAKVQPPRPTKLPAGYELENVGLHSCEEGGSKAALSRYGDGLKVLTIFALRDEKHNAAKDAGSSSIQQSASSTQQCDFGNGTMVMRRTPQGQLVAVGDLPLAQLRQVLDSTRLLPQNTSGG